MKNNDEYISLYDYRGNATGASGLGKEVYESAKSKGIRVIYKDLPESKQRENYTRIATYPVSFLDEYFGTKSTPNTSNVTLPDIMQRLIVLEIQFEELLKKLETHVPTKIKDEDDDLPF